MSFTHSVYTIHIATVRPDIKLCWFYVKPKSAFFNTPVQLAKKSFLDGRDSINTYMSFQDIFNMHAGLNLIGWGS